MAKKNCTQCLNLNTCRLKEIILNPNISTCNYAEQGCVRYNGKGLGKRPKERILHLLQTNDVVTMQMISEKANLPICTKAEKQIIWNAVNRLIKKGYTIKKVDVKSKKREITYLLVK